jgi:DNA primase catalytic core
MDQKSISDLKASIDLVQYVQSRGIKLKKTGKEYLGLCPLHEDHTPSFSVNPQKQLWKCFGCQRGGDVITFVQELDKISFNEAVEKLGGAAGQPKAGGTSRLQLLSRVFEFYARTYESDARAYEYLKSRGIKSPAIFKRFRFGFCNGSMLKTLSSQLKKELTDIGVLTSKGSEFFYDCVVFPLMDSNGQIVNLYGRASTSSAQAKHRFLPGPHCGLFYPPKGAQNLILTEGIIDALTLCEAGYTNVLPIYGVNGLTEDHLTFIKQERIMQLTLCLDGDESGHKAVPVVTEKLKQTGAAVLNVEMPKDTDINGLFQQKDGAAQFSALLEAATEAISNQAASPTASGQAEHGSQSPSSKALPKETVIENGFLYDFGDRTYRVLEMNLTGMSKLKCNLKVAQGNLFHIDSPDLYLDRQRDRFAQIASERFSVEQAEIAQELYALIDVLETKRLELIRTAGGGTSGNEKKEMTEEERQEALIFLRSKNLIELIQKDFDLCGYIGEETSRLFGYLATVSRFVDKPLGILIVSRSGAGKSQLQDIIGRFVPEEALRKYTRISGQSLFYQQDGNLKYSVLAIAEEKGAEDAIYSIRTLQSDQYLTVAVTTTDPKTGIKRTEEYHVEGPVVIIITTTNPEALDFETRNRFVILTIDESREQTRRILEKQREQDTLEGLVQARAEEGIFKKHRNAQRLLRKDLFVVNPFSKDLTYPDDNLLMRREQNKYRSLIKTIAFLHQCQREVKKVQTASGEVDYIEVVIDDVALANKLAAEVLGRSLDELSPHTRTLLKAIKVMVDELAREQKKKPEEVTFTRRDIRERCGWSIFQVQEHIRQLVDQEYLLMKNGDHNRYSYQLLWDGKGEDGEKFVSGLLDVEELKKRHNGKR